MKYQILTKTGIKNWNNCGKRIHMDIAINFNLIHIERLTKWITLKYIYSAF